VTQKTRQTPSLRPPFDDLSGFPTAAALAAGTRLWRVVSDSRVDDPVWFGCAGTNRFDLHPLSPDGVCYVALDPAGAILEAGFRDAAVAGGQLTITPAMFADRHLRALYTPDMLVLADTEHHHATGFGVTRELSTIVPYMLPQWWAQALHETGPYDLSGIRFEPRHAVGRQAAALFGPRGRGDWRTDDPVRLDAGTLRRELQATGTAVLEPPAAPDNLTVVE
jgi:hypothetical protein